MSAKVGLLVLNEFTNDSRVLKEALSLSHHGYWVEVIALHKLGLASCEDIDGVHVRRIRLVSRGWPKQEAVQLLKYLEFLIRAIPVCFKCNVLHCNDLSALPIGVIAKWLTLGHVKVVYDAHEFEINRNGHNTRAGIRLMAWFERMLVRYANAMMTVSPSIAKAYRRIYRIKSPALVLNCPPYRNATPRCDKFREELRIRSDQKIFLYQGSLSVGRGIEVILEVFARRRTDDVVVVFMGYGSLEGVVRVAAETNKNVFFREAVIPTELLDYTASADFGLMSVEKKCLSYTWCLPNKFFEYLMAGLMILSSDLVEPRRIIKKFGFGTCTAGASVQDFEDGISRIMKMDHTAAREQIERARRIYCWESQERVLLDVYAGL